MRIHYYKKNKESESEATSVKEAKRLLKLQGGSAWTEHYDRDGGLFEVTSIELENNSKLAYNCTYNQHL